MRFVPPASPAAVAGPPAAGPPRPVTGGRRAELVCAVPGKFDPADVRVGQALADVATISLLHERSMRHSDAFNEQLQTALNSRVVTERAKEFAERLGVDMDQAFSLLRDFARNRNLRLSDLPSPS